MAALTVIFTFLSFFYTVQARLNVCAIGEGLTSSCRNAEIDDVYCTEVTDSVNCALQLKQGTVDFASFTAEQALVIADYIDSDVKTVSEVRNKDRLIDEFAFQTVVLVKRDYSEGFEGLRGKKFCHPGFKYDDLWTKRVINEFENTVLKKECNEVSNVTAIEEHIRTAALFFGDSCRPGVWVPGNEDLEKKLKEKYSTLCKLCDNQRQCEYSGKNSHEAAIKCLTDGRGEVAYISQQAVDEYNESGGDKNKFKYLCSTGKTQEYPCSWIRQPWQVVVARNEKLTEVERELQRLKTSNNWDRGLKEIIMEDKYSYLVNTTEKSFTKYVEKGRKFPSRITTTCIRNIRWCTVSDVEYEKCDWLSKASLSAGIEPQLQCNKATDVFECFKRINQSRDDVISIDSNYGYLARKTANLGPLFYHYTTKDKSFVLAVIKEEDANTIKTFNKLKNRNACFSEYGGIGWISFVRTGRDIRILLRSECDYSKSVSKFFGNACAPGARDVNHGNISVQAADKLCSLCRNEKEPRTASVCNADSSNEFYGDIGALKCLHYGSGHVAFVEKFNVSGLPIGKNVHRVICRNNTLASYTGFDVDEDCALSVTVDSETITRRVDENNPYYTLFLRDLESMYGNANKMKIFHMFKEYNNVTDLLFKSNIVGFDETSNPNNKYTKNYGELFQHVDSCTGAGNGGPSINFTMLLSIIFFAILKYMPNIS